MATAALLLGLTVNCLRPEPLALAAFDPSGTGKNLSSATLPEITLATLQGMIDRHEARVVDARPSAFFALGHVPGAINLPLTELQGQKPAGEVRLSAAKEDLLVVYCSDVSCPVAKSAARILETLGYRRVMLFPGGWYAWKKAGLPVETGP